MSDLVFGPPAQVAPAVQQVQLECPGCAVRWTGDAPCWACGGPGQDPAALLHAEQARLRIAAREVQVVTIRGEPDGLAWCPHCVGKLAELLGRLDDVARLIGLTEIISGD